MDVEVTEVVPGEFDVAVAGTTRHRVLVPAGVGVPGVDERDFVAALTAELVERGTPLPDVVDAAGLLGADPRLLAAVEARLESP